MIPSDEMEPDIDATTSTRAIDNSPANQIDAMAKVFGQLRFRQCYEKTMAVSAPPWLQQSINSSAGTTTTSGSSSTIHRKHLIVDLQRADERMHSIIVRSGQLLKEWTEYNASRNKIKSIFCDLIKHEMKFCRQHNVEQYFWKILYYNVIETTRRVMGDATVDATNKADDYRLVCATVIDDGLEFFDLLIQTLTETYNFRLDDFLGAHSGRNLKGLKYVALALVSAQKFAMCKGDLLRYRQQINDSAHFGDAARWYERAYQLIPSNGMPSNQLAILSLYSKRKFDAIFYHMRSLHASNPIKSAKESLVILFDELRKKYQLLEAQHNSRSGSGGGSGGGAGTCAGNSKSNESFKREIWVHPTDGQLNYRTVFLSQNDGESLDSVDLYKKFIFHFSCVHGILFTKVGAESLDSCMMQTLKQFQELLNHRTSGVFTLQKMVQMFVLNVMAIENCVRNEASSLTSAAVAFAFAFIGIVLNKLKIELDELIATGINGLIEVTPRRTIAIKNISRFRWSDSIINSMACVSLWCNWLKGNRSVWSSAADLHAIHGFSKTFGLCVWDELAKLITTLAQFDLESTADCVIVCSAGSSPEPNYVRFRLPEENLTLGMPHLLLTDNLYCKGGAAAATANDDGDDNDGDKHITNVSAFQRMKNIYGFCSTDLLAAAVIQVDATGRRSERALLKKLKSGKFISTNICNSDKDDALCHSTSAYHNETAVHSMEEQKHSSAAAAAAVAATAQVANIVESATTPQPFNERSNADNDAENDVIEQRDGSSAEIQKLLQRKNELEQSHKWHEKHNQFTQEILQKDNADTSVCIEIRPKYLVPDTNCYIDFLREIKQLTDTYPLYHVIVPIVVLNELEGLAKGDASGGTKVYDTPTKTSRLAQKALLFLKNAGTVVKCATTKGSFLNSMTFTRESHCSSATSAAEHLNNDDKILLTVTNLSKIHSAPPMATMQNPANATSTSGSNLHRKVVLLTNDRNLKLKAITQNIPVRELVDFIKWSSITK